MTPAARSGPGHRPSGRVASSPAIGRRRAWGSFRCAGGEVSGGQGVRGAMRAAATLLPARGSRPRSLAPDSAHPGPR